MGKYKIQINDNWNMIYNYINSATTKVDWFELVQFCVDYDCYKEFYFNINIWKILVDERNNNLPVIKKLNDENVGF